MGKTFKDHVAVDLLFHHTAEDPDDGLSSLFYGLQAADMSEETVVRVGAYATGVKQRDIGFLNTCRLYKACFF